MLLLLDILGVLIRATTVEVGETMVVVEEEEEEIGGGVEEVVDASMELGALMPIDKNKIGTGKCMFFLLF